ncbi:MAG: hypothetical protein EOS53_24635 [Mesorhizobium sp.]|nr:MAG: hypothetical protein EOS53_24635 [Mesorhizobium sp.]
MAVHLHGVPNAQHVTGEAVERCGTQLGQSAQRSFEDDPPLRVKAQTVVDRIDPGSQALKQLCPSKPAHVLERLVLAAFPDIGDEKCCLVAFRVTKPRRRASG